MTDLILSRRAFLKASLAASVLGGCTMAFGAKAWAASSQPRPVPLRKPRTPRLLMIDPGHGGRDPGAVSRSGAYEKDITLDIARRMAKSLSAEQGLIIKMTRESDDFLPLEERVRMGREAHADLFLSIHADSAPNKTARGLSVYTLSTKASDAFAKSLADKENRADLVGGMDLPPADKEVTAILLDLATRQTRNTAQHAKASFVGKIKHKWRLLEQPMRAANFVVLRAPDVPSMLVETGFLSNPQDERILLQPHQREKIARLMASTLGSILDSSLFG